MGLGGKVALLTCLFVGFSLAGWRLWHPPIEERMAYQMELAQKRRDLCDFWNAYQAYRSAKALDGRNKEAVSGMYEMQQKLKALEVGMVVPGCVYKFGNDKLVIES